MQLVYEFGAQKLDPVVQVIQLALGSVQYSVQCMHMGSDSSEPTEDSFRSAALKLEDGTLSSFWLHPKDGLIRYAMVTCPFFAGEHLSVYFGTIESLDDDFKTLWDLILSVPELSFACLGFEEGVELEDCDLSDETFPWNEWPLVIGALPDQSGSRQWTIRHGPEMRWFAKVS